MDDKFAKTSEFILNYHDYMTQVEFMNLLDLFDDFELDINDPQKFQRRL